MMCIKGLKWSILLSFLSERAQYWTELQLNERSESKFPTKTPFIPQYDGKNANGRKSNDGLLR
jgi:hypothetical protein